MNGPEKICEPQDQVAVEGGGGVYLPAERAGVGAGIGAGGAGGPEEREKEYCIPPC